MEQEREHGREGKQEPNDEGTLAHESENELSPDELEALSTRYGDESVLVLELSSGKLAWFDRGFKLRKITSAPSGVIEIIREVRGQVEKYERGKWDDLEIAPQGQAPSKKSSGDLGL